MNSTWYDTKPATLTNSLTRAKATRVEENTASETAIYPNPATGNTFNVYTPWLKANETATLSIVDANGKTALTTQVHQSARIAYNLKPGLYIIRITSKGLNSTKKLVVQ